MESEKESSFPVRRLSCSTTSMHSGSAILHPRSSSSPDAAVLSAWISGQLLREVESSLGLFVFKDQTLFSNPVTKDEIYQYNEQELHAIFIAMFFVPVEDLFTA